MSKKKEIEVKIDTKVEKGQLISRLNYAVMVIYNKENIRVNPRERKSIDNIRLLGNLPDGIVLRIL